MFDFEYGIPVCILRTTCILLLRHTEKDIFLSAKRMERKFGNLLNDAISRKHKKFSFITVYSHENNYPNSMEKSLISVVAKLVNAVPKAICSLDLAYAIILSKT